MVSSTIIHAIEHITYRQNGRVVEGDGLRIKSLWLRGFESHSKNLVDIPKESIISFILNTCIWCHLPLSILMTKKHTGKMAEWSMVLVKGTSQFGDMGWSQTPLILSPSIESLS